MGEWTTFVGMPKATMNEDGFTASGECNVWSARHALGVQTVTVPHKMKELADHQLGTGILAADTGHEGASIPRREVVDHAFPFLRHLGLPETAP
jgi:hypothetical protein